MDVKEIPVIDFRRVRDGRLEPGTDEWNELTKQVMDASKSCGCFRALYDHKPSEIYEDILSLGKYIFDLPLENKRKHIRKKPYYGYVEADPRFPLYESMSLSGVPDLEAVQAFVDLIWPEGNPKAFEAFKSFYEDMATLDLIIRKMIVEGLGVGNLYESLLKSTTGYGFFTKYSAPLPNETAMGVGSHTDKDFVALIFQDEVGGLEFQPKGGPWIPIPPIPNSFIAIIGDCFKVWSNDRLEHGKHRVVMNGSKERFSFSYFSIPKDGIPVTIPEELVDSDHPRLFRPFDYKDYIAQCSATDEALNPSLYTYAGI